MEDYDGCVYDTVICDHGCRGCDFGKIECKTCGEWIHWPDNFCENCENEEDQRFEK